MSMPTGYLMTISLIRSIFWIIKNGGNTMNAMQIRKMLNNIKADFIGMGRHWHDNDDSVMELLMQIYYQTDYIDWQEVKWLFINYLKKGILDFPTAKKMTIKRISA